MVYPSCVTRHVSPALCTRLVYQSCVTRPFSPVLCTHSVYPSCVPVICTRPVSPFLCHPPAQVSEVSLPGPVLAPVAQVRLPWLLLAQGVPPMIASASGLSSVIVSACSKQTRRRPTTNRLTRVSARCLLVWLRPLALQLNLS